MVDEGPSVDARGKYRAAQAQAQLLSLLHSAQSFC
jgi:hypothetical protein